MRTHVNRDTILLLTVAFILPLAGFKIWSAIDRGSDLPVLYEGKTVDYFSLTNQRNQAETPASWQGKITVVNFFFSHCPVVCKKMIHNTQLVQQKYVDDPLVRFVSFTVDPERDSVGRLVEYIRTQKIDDRRWDFVTGDKKVIYSLARNGFRVVAAKGDGGADDFIHSENMVLLDTAGRVRGFYAGTKPDHIEQLILDIKKLHYDSSN